MNRLKLIAILVS